MIIDNCSVATIEKVTHPLSFGQRGFNSRGCHFTSESENSNFLIPVIGDYPRITTCKFGGYQQRRLLVVMLDKKAIYR